MTRYWKEIKGYENKYKKSMKDLTYDMDIEHLLRTCKALDYSQKEIERLNNIIDELEKWLNEYYKSNRKWYNTELSNHDKQYYEEIYRNTEFMIVKFLKQLKELKENNKDV